MTDAAAATGAPRHRPGCRLRWRPFGATPHGKVEDLQPEDAFADALIYIAESNARHNVTSFAEEAESMIADFGEVAVPETIPYM